MGFREDIRSLLRYLPHKDQRQTLLFSATVPPSVQEMIDVCVRPERALVDCIQDDDPASHTVNTVQQTHAIIPQDKLVTGIIQTILHLIKTHQDQHKILVFFPTTSQVAYYSSVFNNALGQQVLEIHSRKSQDTRSNTSERFRRAKTAVMFTSDVSARGVDYPDVTHVVQVGAARDRETYIHRLGRTGRAGKSGKGILLLMEEEMSCLDVDLVGIDIPRDDKLQELMDNGSEDLKADMMELQRVMDSGRAYDLEKKAAQVYSSLFGYYNSVFKEMGLRRPRDALVGFVNAFANQAGLKALPPVNYKLAQQLGLADHPDLNVRAERRGGGDGYSRGGGYGGGGGYNSRGGYGSGGGGYGSRGGGYSRGGGSGYSRGGRGGYDNRPQGGYEDRRGGGGGSPGRSWGWKGNSSSAGGGSRPRSAFEYGDPRDGGGADKGFGSGGRGRGGDDLW